MLRAHRKLRRGPQTTAASPVVLQSLLLAGCAGRSQGREGAGRGQGHRRHVPELPQQPARGRDHRPHPGLMGLTCQAQQRRVRAPAVSILTQQLEAANVNGQRAQQVASHGHRDRAGGLDKNESGGK